MHETPGHDGQRDVESRKHRKTQPQPACKFPGEKVMFKLYEKVRHDEPDDRLEAARRVACILAVHKQPGFDDVLTYLEQHQKKDLRNWKKKK